MIFPASHVTDTYETKYDCNQVTTENPRRQLMQTTNVHSPKSNKTKA